MKHFFKLIFIFLILISCKKENVINDPQYYLKYDSITIETNGSSLYLYDKIDNDFYYTFTCGNGTFTSTGFDINDSYSNNDFLKLHFKGDSITLETGIYPIIADSNCYIILGYNDTTKAYILKDYIVSGTFSIQTRNDLGFPLTASFNGKTESGKIVSSYNFLSSQNVNYKLQRKVKGQYRFLNNNFEISIVEVYIKDSSYLKVYLRDYNFDLHTQNGLDFWIYKKDLSQLEGIYNANKIGNSDYFIGLIQDYSYYTEDYITNTYIHNGILKIDKISSDNYKIDFQIKTDENDSIIGNCISSIKIEKI